MKPLFGTVPSLPADALGINQFFIQDLVAEIDALVADINARSGDQLAHLLLGLSTERALQMGVEFGHQALRRSIMNQSPFDGSSPGTPRITVD